MTEVRSLTDLAEYAQNQIGQSADILDRGMQRLDELTADLERLAEQRNLRD